MPKNFILCPSKRRNLEMFIREELAGSRSPRQCKDKCEQPPRTEDVHLMSHLGSTCDSLTNVDIFTHKLVNSGKQIDAHSPPSFYFPGSARHSFPYSALRPPTPDLSPSESSTPLVSVSPSQPSPSQDTKPGAVDLRLAVHSSGGCEFRPSIRSGFDPPPSLTSPSVLPGAAMSIFQPASVRLSGDTVHGLDLSYLREGRDPRYEKMEEGQTLASCPARTRHSVGSISPHTHGSSIFHFGLPRRDQSDHVTKSQVQVDPSIPFTTYLHNLTRTLRQAVAARDGREVEIEDQVSTDSDRKQTEPDSSSTEEDGQTVRSRDDQAQDKGLSRDRKRKHSNDDDVVNDTNETVGDRDCGSTGQEDDEDEGEREEEKEKTVPPKLREKFAIKALIQRSQVPRLYIPEPGHSLADHVTEGHVKPFSAPVHASPSLPFSPSSSLLSASLSLHQHHHLPPRPHPHDHQQHFRPLPYLRLEGPQVHLPPTDPALHVSHHHHHHQHQSLQYPVPSLAHSHLSIARPLVATAPTLLHSPLSGSVGSVFHPNFLGLGGVGMRRTSVDKPVPVKKYKCDVCQKAFSRSNTLVTHKRIHTGDKPFKCEVCGRAFRQPGNLTRHRLTHTTHKPYVCHVCSKAFNRASNLNTHIRTHSTFRQFVCSVCPKSFHQKADLATHIFSHTGERPYKCDICGRGFSHTNTLATHRRSHTDLDLPARPGEEGCAVYV